LELAALVALATVAAGWYARGGLPSDLGTFAGPAILLVVAGLVSVAIAENPRPAAREWRTLILEPALFYLAARSVFRRPQGAMPLALAFLVGAGLAAVLALGQSVSGRGLVVAEGVARAAALYPSPNNLALLLDRAVPLALACSLYGRAWGPRIVRLADVATALTLVALFLSFSRGAWLATLVAVAIVCWPHLARLLVRRRLPPLHWIAAVAALAVAGAATVMALRVERFGSLVSPVGTGLLRLRLWEAAVAMIGDHPLLGVGLDQFLYHYPRYIHAEAWREPGLSHPHNLLLDFWLRLGLLGVVFAVWTASLLARRLLPSIRSAWAATPDRRRSFPLALGAAGAAVGTVLHGMVDNSYFVADLAYAWWVVVLIAELNERHIPAGQRDPGPAVSREVRAWL
jgi:O-antigen ligase